MGEIILRNVLDLLCRNPIKIGSIEQESDMIKKKRALSKKKERKVHENLQPLEDIKMMSKAKHQKVFSDAWLTFLSLPLRDGLYIKVLKHIHLHVMPNMTSPLILSDFLIKSLDKGGIIGILALHGVFLLVTRYGLDYPRIYERLYTLLHPNIMYSEHQTEFFRLSNIFLSSPMIPAYCIASFVKRFARISIYATPYGTILCLFFIHNLIRRHPVCNQLINRLYHSTTKLEIIETFADPYLENETEPKITKALESSLWEIVVLTKHYHWQVASLANDIIKKGLGLRNNKNDMDIENAKSQYDAIMISREHIIQKVRFQALKTDKTRSHLYDYFSNLKN